MAVPWKIMTRIRSKLVHELGWEVGDIIDFTDGEVAVLDDQFVDRFFTFDRDTQQIVANVNLNGWHFIFDQDGNMIKKHRH